MKQKKLVIFFIIAFCLLFVSCKDKEIENNKPEDELTFENYDGIDENSVVYRKNGKISVISDIYKNTIILSSEEGYVFSYRENTNSYLKGVESTENTKLLFGINNKEYNLEKFYELYGGKQSLKGDKILYKKYNDEDEIEFYIFDSNKEKDEILEIDTLISGENYFWRDDDTIIYYGINEKEDKNGIFSYNISSREEKLLYEVKQGIIEYMKLTDGDVYFIINSLDGNKDINKFSLKDNVLTKITDKFNYVDAIIEQGNAIYILGEEESNGISLFSISDNNMKKLIYDFPKQIDEDKGLSKDKDGNILFIGYENIKEDEDVYAFDPRDKSIKIISKKTGEYFFIETN